MVIDTSAIVAILFGEPETRRFAHAIDQAPLRLMSAVSVLEATMVVESELCDAGGRELDLLLHRAGIEIVGPLPGALQKFTTFSAGTLAAATDPEAVAALVRFIAAEARPLLARKGLEPA